MKLLRKFIGWERIRNHRYLLSSVSGVAKASSGLRFHPSQHMKRSIIKVKPLTLSYITQTCLECIAFSVYAPCFDFSFACWIQAATRLHLRYAVSYTKHLTITNYYSIEFLMTFKCTVSDTLRFISKYYLKTHFGYLLKNR